MCSISPVVSRPVDGIDLLYGVPVGHQLKNPQTASAALDNQPSCEPSLGATIRSDINSTDTRDESEVRFCAHSSAR